MPLPCSPVSNSTASESYSALHTSGEDSDASLTTPRAGPSDPALRSSDSLSRPSVPVFPFGVVDKGDGVRAGNSLPAAPSPPSTAASFKGAARKSSLRFQQRETSPRRRALYTSSSMSRTSPTVSPHGSSRRPQHGNDVAESSADENTAILPREGSSAVRAYGAAAAPDDVHSDAALTRRKALGKAKDLGSTGEASTKDGSSPASETWWKRTVEKYGSVELENKGSVARDHLALERTFLAWLRTSLSFASIGIAITQLFRLNTAFQSDGGGSSSTMASNPAAPLKQIGKPLGATFLGISILILLLGFNRYFEGQYYVIRGKFPASRATVVLVAAVAGALIVASLIVVLLVAPSAFET